MQCDSELKSLVVLFRSLVGYSKYLIIKNCRNLGWTIKDEISLDLNMVGKSVIFLLSMGVLKFAIVRDYHFILLTDFSPPERQRLL